MKKGIVLFVILSEGNRRITIQQVQNKEEAARSDAEWYDKTEVCDEKESNI